MTFIPNYVPSPYKTVNVQIIVKNALKALDFYNRAFNAEVIMKLTDPQGVVVHAEFKVADTIIVLSEENPKLNLSPTTLGGATSVIQLYTGDVESIFEESVKAGAEVIFPIQKQFYGDRAGRIRDPFGHEWIIATHMEDLSASEIQKRFNELYAP